MKMVKSVYKKILENVPTHMPETGGMLGGQDGTVTKVVFDGGKDDDFRRCHYTPNVTMLNSCLVEWSESGIEFYGLFHHCQKEMKYILKRYWRQCHNPRKSCSFRLLFCRIKKSYHIAAV